MQYPSECPLIRLVYQRGHSLFREKGKQMHYGLFTEQSRKARAAKSLFEMLRTKGRAEPIAAGKLLEWTVQSGFQVPGSERFRVLNLRFHDEHLSPYFKTDMNLFHLLMLDEQTDIAVLKTDDGILFTFEGLPDTPQKFSLHGHDTR